MIFTIDTPIQDSSLSAQQKKSLASGNITSFADLLVTPLSDVARRCKISAQDAKHVYDKLFRDCSTTELTLLDDLDEPLDDIFSTGDSILDQALGGGIRTGMLWEIVGESSAGKTQVALQLSLTVQNPPSSGGLSGSACYLTTSAKLPTSRLKQISEHHPSLSPGDSLNNVHTLSVSTVPILDNILMNVLPNFIQSKVSSARPVRLVVIDALTELFHSADKTTKDTIFTRSKDLNRIASALHVLAGTYNVAVVVLNEVIDRFDKGIPLPPPPPRASSSSKPGPSSSKVQDNTGMVYNDKSRWFSTCDSIPGENAKEASLGLVWANQLNARIMLTRTGRRRYLDAEIDLSSKKAKLSGAPQQAVIMEESDEPQATLVRRLSVIFSSVSMPVSLDYVVTTEGVRVLLDEGLLDELKTQSYSFVKDAPATEPHQPRLSQSQAQSQPVDNEEDEWDQYWEGEGDISKHFEDFDALELRLTQAMPSSEAT